MITYETPARKIVIIPSCYNSAQVVKVLAAFKEKAVDEICLIVDAPLKNDLQILDRTTKNCSIPTHIIINDERKGIGSAIRQGIKYAMNNHYEIAVVMAGNGKDQPDEIPRLLAPIILGHYDYVQGSRFLKGGRAVKNPFFRRVFSRLFPFVWTLFTKFRCTDVTNGFRAYRLSLFSDPRINIWQHWLNNYELEYYIHYKAITLGYKVLEVPVSKIYPYKHKGGYSNIKPFNDWWKIVGPLIYLKTGMRK